MFFHRLPRHFITGYTYSITLVSSPRRVLGPANPLLLVVLV
jgi:hypothetical protein